MVFRDINGVGEGKGEAVGGLEHVAELNRREGEEFFQVESPFVGRGVGGGEKGGEGPVGLWHFFGRIDNLICA